jgi:hypothetical protein
MAAAAESASWPTAPVVVLVVVPVSITHRRSMTPRLLRTSGPPAWRAGGAPLKPWRNLSQIRISAVVPEG